MRGLLSILGVVVLLVLPVTVQADTGFAYQGQLQHGGVPYTGSQTLRFRLYDSLEDSIEVATMIEIEDVEVVEGLFQVNLDFGPSVFDGQPRYIEVEVGGQVLQPRQAVSPSPVALFALSGNEGPPGEQGPQGEPGEQGPPGDPGDSHWGLNAGATYYMDGYVGIGTNDPEYSLHVISDADKRSIVGVHSAPSGGSFGGWFESESTSGRGVYGLASSPTGVNFGVVGQSSSSSGRGVHGVASSSSGTAYGVLGQSSSDTGHGVYGMAGSSSGTTYGVLGQVNSPDGYAGYFAGGRNYFQGNVGIGVPDPQYRLDIYGSGARISSMTSGGPRLELKGHAVGTPSSFLLGAVDFVDIDDEYAGGISYRRTLLGDRLWLSAGGSDAVGIDQDGRVGIGVVVPNVQLHVAGGTNAQLNGGGFIAIGDLASSNIVLDNNEILARNNGEIAPLHLNKFGGEVHVGFFSDGAGRLVTPVVQITGGSDLSENFDVAEINDLTPQPGMVVSIDPQNPGRLIPSTRAYDRTVAGIISGANGINSGMVMGQKGSEADGAHPVALTGRVYVMADTTRGAIEPGDLLTTSDVPGHAMAVTDFAKMHGAVIGKAMTGLAMDEAGMILVLVNLQ